MQLPEALSGPGCRHTLTTSGEVLLVNWTDIAVAGSGRVLTMATYSSVSSGVRVLCSTAPPRSSMDIGAGTDVPPKVCHCDQTQSVDFLEGDSSNLRWSGTT